MNGKLIHAAVAVATLSGFSFGIAVQTASAASGVIVSGNNGTSWCCRSAPVPGQIWADINTCVKATTTIAGGSACSFAADRANPNIGLDPNAPGQPAEAKQAPRKKTGAISN